MKKTSDDILIKAEGLYKSFDLQSGFFAKKDKLVYAVNNVSFDIKKGETYGIVGESGCGKTTTARLLIRMYDLNSGKIYFYNEDGTVCDISSFKKQEIKSYQEKVKYVFQDPAKSLNPRMNVFSVMTDGLKYSLHKYSKQEIQELAEKAIVDVGLSKDDLQKRPAEFSGGQRQRISIARGLLLNPSLLICDEVVSALDVSIQAQVLKLLSELREKRNLSMLFITHDLRVACYFCDRIGVMYRGVLVEEADAATLYKSALHPYTKLLFEAAMMFKINSSVEVKTMLEKENACPFAHRCPKAEKRCFEECPELTERENGHKVRCWF
ncbi:MAG: ABC transporter ATP-binding protein [Treponema sp.]|nr:ABC transporter ATP-binding protein [Treponema sp.]